MLASAISNTLGASDFDSLQNPGARIISMLNIRNTSTACARCAPSLNKWVANVCSYTCGKKVLAFTFKVSTSNMTYTTTYSKIDQVSAGCQDLGLLNHRTERNSDFQPISAKRLRGNYHRPPNIVDNEFSTHKAASQSSKWCALQLLL